MTNSGLDDQNASTCILPSSVSRLRASDVASRAWLTPVCSDTVMWENDAGMRQNLPKMDDAVSHASDRQFSGIRQAPKGPSYSFAADLNARGTEREAAAFTPGVSLGSHKARGQRKFHDKHDQQHESTMQHTHQLSLRDASPPVPPPSPPSRPYPPPGAPGPLSRQFRRR
jgi:hypothetical protein